MKLKDLAIKIQNSDTYTESSVFNPSVMYGKEGLEKYKEELLKTDEFSECEELIILDTPIVADNIGGPTSIRNYKVVEGTKFKGRCYLLSLDVTGEMYEPTSTNRMVKNGASLSPHIYDMETFVGRKEITLTFNPEKYQDSEIIDGENLIKQELHDTLDDILNNPEEYQIKGERHLLVRGLFDEIVDPEEKQKPLTSEYSVVQPPKYFMVFYLEDADSKDENGETVITKKLNKKYIPYHLQKEYINRHGKKGTDITAEEIEDFLKEFGEE